jgi:integrase
MMFAGIRPSEIRSKEKPPMEWKQVDFDERIVRITSAQSKTRNARILEGLPSNLWAFLESSHKKKESEFIAPARYRQARKLAKESIGRWSHDVCRHSFITYHLAQFKNISETMLIAGHEGSPSTMYQKYRGLATKAEAEKYFNIQPKVKP